MRLAGKQRSLPVGVPSKERSWLELVAHRFDVVPVGADDEGCVVARVVLRADAGRTVVTATRLQRRTMERVDLLSSLGKERQVKMRRLLLGLVQTQGSFAAGFAKLGAVRRPLQRSNA